MIDLNLEQMLRFDKLKRISYRFTVTPENIDSMTECIKNLITEKCDINIDICRDGDEIDLELYEIY